MGVQRQWVVLVALVGLLSGCSSTAERTLPSAGYAADGAVSGEIVDMPSSGRYQVLPGSSYSQPMALQDNRTPEYPHALLDRRLPPVSVVVRLIVGGDGAVEDARILDADDAEPAFAQAVVAAVSGWTFVPLRRITGTQSEPLPFSQEYRFTFSQHNGRAVVAGGTASTH